MIDTSEWKEFRVSDIFVTEKHGLNLQVPTGAMMSKKDLEDGNIPRVTVSNFKNGITGYYADSDNKNYRTYQNFISVSFLGTVFYQPDKVSLDMKVHCLKPLDYEFNVYSASYIVAIIRKAISNFAYSDQLSSTVLAELEFSLPATSDGQPDWAYMESYMKGVMEETEKSLGYLRKADDTKNLIDTKDWKIFKLEDLFMISISLSVDKTAFEFDDSYDIDFIGRTSINNGIQGKLYELKYAPNEAGTYSVTQIGTKVCQYRENRWYASQNIFKLVPLDNAMNKASKFLTTVITQALKCTYSDDTYSSYPTLKSLCQQEIKLPVDAAGEPNWVYMENFMKQIELKAKQKLDLLKVNEASFAG